MESMSPYLKKEQRFRESDRVFKKGAGHTKRGDTEAASLYAGISVPPRFCLLRAKAVIWKTGEIAIRVRRSCLLALCYAYASF